MEEEKPKYEQLLQIYEDEAFAIGTVLCNDAFDRNNFFKKFPKSQKIVDLFGLGVHEKYRKQGIAKKLFEKSMQVWLKYFQSNILIFLKINFY